MYSHLQYNEGIDKIIIRRNYDLQKYTLMGLVYF